MEKDSIFTYLKWRKDLQFTQDAFRTLDALAFSCLSYVRFDALLQENSEPITLQDLAKAYQNLPLKQQTSRVEEDKQILYEMAESRRYGDALIIRYVSHFDEQQQKQFCAMSFLLHNGDILIAFRGTDSTLVGWKEDFNMSFLPVIPSQQEAALYVEETAAQYEGKLIICGHSKGGNLAVYASAFVKKEIQDRISAVYNMDGPGFDEKVLTKTSFANILPRIHTFVPQSSVVGMLLQHEEAYHVIQSNQVSLWQHDPYSWLVDGADFIYLQSINASSEFFDHTLKTWLSQMEEEQRAMAVDAIYDILSRTNANTLKDLSPTNVKNLMVILKGLSELDEATRKVLQEMMISFFASMRLVMSDNVARIKQNENKALQK